MGITGPGTHLLVVLRRTENQGEGDSQLDREQVPYQSGVKVAHGLLHSTTMCLSGTLRAESLLFALLSLQIFSTWGKALIPPPNTG